MWERWTGVYMYMLEKPRCSRHPDISPGHSRTLLMGPQGREYKLPCLYRDHSSQLISNHRYPTCSFEAHLIRRMSLTSTKVVAIILVQFKNAALEDAKANCPLEDPFMTPPAEFRDWRCLIAQIKFVSRTRNMTRQTLRYDQSKPKFTYRYW